MARADVLKKQSVAVWPVLIWVADLGFRTFHEFLSLVKA